MISESAISKCPQHKVKPKIGNIFVNEKILEEYSAKIYKIDPYFHEDCKEKIQVDKNGREYILFRIDVYFTEYPLVVETDEKSHASRDLIFEEKRQEALEKRLNCELIRTNTSKRYDEDYEIGRTETFTSKFKHRQIKKVRKRIKQRNKRTRRRNRRIKTSIDKLNHSIKSKCLKCIVRNVLPTI